MSSSSSSSVAMKAVLLSTAVVSAALLLKFSLPVILDFLTSQLPVVLSWLQPPYMYLILNCIILSIVASSKLQLQPRPVENVGVKEEREDVTVAPMEVFEEREDVTVAPMEVVFGYVDPDMVRTTVVSGESDDYEVSRSVWSPPLKREEAIECCSPVSGRFAHRRLLKASPEGKTVLGVLKPKRQETLGSTWRTITDGRPMPLRRHLRKSETFVGNCDTSPPVRLMKKSETFGGSKCSPGSGGSSGRLASLSQDELNRRVEAFINKFNQEMRLQRQESFNHQYTQMMGGKTHLLQ